MFEVSRTKECVHARVGAGGAEAVDGEAEAPAGAARRYRASSASTASL